MADHAKQVISKNSEDFRVIEKDVAAAGKPGSGNKVETTMEIAMSMSKANTKPAMKFGNSS